MERTEDGKEPVNVYFYSKTKCKVKLYPSHTQQQQQQSPPTEWTAIKHIFIWRCLYVECYV